MNMSWCTSSPGSSCRGWEGSEWWAWVSQGYSDEGRDNVWDGVVWEGAVSVLQGNENKSKIWKQCLPVRNEVSWTQALTCKVLIWNIFAVFVRMPSWLQLEKTTFWIFLLLNSVWPDHQTRENVKLLLERKFLEKRFLEKWTKARTDEYYQK